MQRADGTQAALTAQEVALLRYLAEHAGRTVPRAELFERVLGYSEAAAARSRALDATIRRLRRKLEADPEAPAHLQTDHGQGFRLTGLRAVGGPAPVAAPTDAAFGSDAPLQALAALPAAAIATLVGPGGVGKSRVARQLAAGGRWAWVAVPEGPLEALVSAVVAAVGLPDSVRGGTALQRALPALGLDGIVLDAAEVAVDAVAELLAACVGPRWVVTSRVRLGLVEERVVTVAPLTDADAAALLCHRAAQRAGGPWASPDDPAVRALVARLDGLPLALELAAARAPVLGPEELDAWLGEPGVLRDPGRDERHTSLDEVIAASWTLLDPDAQRALVALSVFHGPFPPAAGVAVAGGLDPLQALVTHHLVRARDEDGRLAPFDTVRAFAARRAEGPPWASLRPETDRRYAACADLPGLTPRDRLVAARLALHLDPDRAERAALLLLRPAPSPDPPLPPAEALALAAEVVAVRPDALRVAAAAASLGTLGTDREQVDAWLQRLDDAAARATPDERLRLAIAGAELAAAAGARPRRSSACAPASTRRGPRASTRASPPPPATRACRTSTAPPRCSSPSCAGRRASSPRGPSTSPTAAPCSRAPRGCSARSARTRAASTTPSRCSCAPGSASTPSARRVASRPCSGTWPAWRTGAATSTRPSGSTRAPSPPRGASATCGPRRRPATTPP
ncbi:MAG: winged helix-turn-helix domain-containing protein [Myxococcota bacterium]